MRISRTFRVECIGEKLGLLESSLSKGRDKIKSSIMSKDNSINVETRP